MPMKKTLGSAALTLALLVAVPAGAMLLWGSSAGAATQPIGVRVFDYENQQLQDYLALNSLSADQRIQKTIVIRASEQGTASPSTGSGAVLERFSN